MSLGYKALVVCLPTGLIGLWAISNSFAKVSEEKKTSFHKLSSFVLGCAFCAPIFRASWKVGAIVLSLVWLWDACCYQLIKSN